MREHPDFDLLRVWCTFHPDVVENIKEIPGRRWDSNLRCWTVPTPYEEEVLSILYNFCDEVDRT